MNRDDLVSVVIIFLDPGPYLVEAIESVRRQTHASWELLLVDDGSTDGSRELASELARAEPGRIRALEHAGRANLGMSASRNLGLSQARGRWVAYLDADDRWVPSKLAEQLALLGAQPEAAMVYGRALLWHGWSGRPEDAARDVLRPLGVPEDRLLRPPELVRALLAGSALPPSSSSMLLRRDAALAVGGYDDSFRGMYEDQVFVTKLALRFPVLTSGRCWDWYRQHPASACGVAAAEGRASVERARLAFLDWVASWLEREGAQDEELRHELSRQLWLYRHWRREPADERAHARALRRRWAKKWVLRAERALAPRAVRRLLWRPRPSSGR